MIIGKLYILSVKPTTQKFELRGGQGWLYSERELNYACSVYGHGKGADQSQVTEYRVGNPIVAGEARIDYLRGSGARSFSLQDLEELGKITEGEKKKMYSGYGETTYYSLRVPTIMAANSYKQSDKTYTSSQGMVATYYGMNQTELNRFGVLRGRIINETYYYISSSKPQYSIYDESSSTENYFSIIIMGERENYITIFNDEYRKKDNALISTASQSLRPIVTLRTDIQLEQTTAGVYKIK